MARIVLFIFLLVLGVGISLSQKSVPQGKPLTPPASEKSFEQQSPQVVAMNLNVPWELEFLPNGEILLTERGGLLKTLTLDGQVKTIAKIEDASGIGEGGLLGLVLHPKFASNRLLYLYYTYKSSGEDTLNRVIRYTFNGVALEEKAIVVDAIPGSANHNGGRIKFGPDGFVYITTGDAQNPSLAQDKNSLAGKILRVNDDGSIPSDNPFSNSPVYSYGHRNPQGLAWDKDGQLWATEHGSSAFDEVNLVVAGQNYGWPKVRGSDSEQGLEAPYLHSGTSTWAPSGATIIGDSLFFSGLRGSAIFELNLKTKNLKKHFENQFGRIRTITLGPDGFFYILTNNRDGRGNPTAEDDRIIKFHPELFGVTLK
ncbi:MAG: PQQ-dependent sugar dehydrogenase [Candidatus Blackburnbacteria bacterium]|nr:PQQ-dependent sugar dehydrogenase [Candidatus Blackburnbacteria bacterium]